MADVDLAAPPPSIGAAERNQIVFGPRGALGWTQGLAAWRARVLASDRLDHVLAFARADITTTKDTIMMLNRICVT